MRRTYVFLYAYNGPQSVQLQLNGEWARCVAPQYAEHQGDIESMTMRVDPTLTTVQFIRFEAHGTSTWYAPHEVSMQGTQAIVGCALNSHASYNVAGQSDTYAVMLDEYSAAGYGMNIVDFVNRMVPRGSRPSSSSSGWKMEPRSSGRRGRTSPAGWEPA